MADEDQKEREHMIRGMFPKMKVWYLDPRVSNGYLVDKYGPFPQFWQDLSNWEHVKRLQKIYLIYCERKDSGCTGDQLDIRIIDSSIQTSTASATSQAPANQIRKKRKFTDGPRDITVSAVETPETKEDLATEQSSQVLSQNKANSTLVTDITKAAISSGTMPAKAAEQPTRGRARERRSRWSDNSLGLPDIPGLLDPSTGLTKEQMQRQLLLRVKLQKISDRLPHLAAEAAQIEQNPDRSPSPPPVYGPDGKRKNTREERMKEALMQESRELIDEILTLNPSYVAPTGFTKSKPFAKIFVPVKEFPTYNFIGLILGPRGSTQKDMETKTRCRISIRGKGSMRDGSRGRISKDMHEAEAEDLHVYIAGEEAEGVEEAKRMVQELLKPLDDELNEHKQKQLRQLALINGTLRDSSDEYCPLCGERGHRQYECPHRAVRETLVAGVKCSICGDMSHPTRDCPMARHGHAVADAGQLDQAYNAFVAELEGKAPVPPTAAVATAAAPTASQDQAPSLYDMLAAAAPAPRPPSSRTVDFIKPVVAQPYAPPQPQVQALPPPPPTTAGYAASGLYAYNAYHGAYGASTGYYAAPDPAHPFDNWGAGQTDYYTQAQTTTTDVGTGSYDAQWMEYFQQNPAAYQQYVQEQMQLQYDAAYNNPVAAPMQAPIPTPASVPAPVPHQVPTNAWGTQEPGEEPE